MSFEEFEPFEELRENCPLKQFNFFVEGSVYFVFEVKCLVEPSVNV